MNTEIVTHFKILEKLGSGGMGEVYKAIDLKLNRPVALKFLTSSYSFDSEQRDRLLNEAEAVSSLDHNNICTVYEVDETEDDRIFIAMAYYEGETLKEKLKKGSIEFKQAVEIIIQTAEGLLSAHEKAIIHRDIKPDNIFITNDGVVKILDFGIAKILNQTHITKFDSTPGTIAYMSPEQIKDEEVDQRTDIWSLGVVFYEMLTGQRPFKGESDPAMIYSILNEEPAELNIYYKNYPETIQHIINKLLHKDKQLRYSFLYELIKDLNLIIGEKLTLKKKLSLNKKRLKVYSVMVGFLLIFLILLLAFNEIFLTNKKNTTDKIPLAVIPFENQTGDTTYNYLQTVIPNLLITRLEQTNYFNIITFDELYDLAKQNKIKDMGMIKKDTWLEICKKGNADMVISGIFTRDGDKFLNDLKILKTDTKKLITSLITESDNSENLLLEQVNEMTIEISRELGVLKIADINNLTPLSDVTTKSLTAYNYYLMGKKEFDKLNFEKSKDLLQKAIELDSTFAVAYAYLGINYSNLHDARGMNWAMQKAKKYSYKASAKEQGIIDAQHAILIESDLGKFVSIYENLEKQYPREKWFHICLGFGYYKQNRYQKAISQKEKILEVDPDHHSTLNSLGYLYLDLKDFNTASTYFTRLTKAYPNDANSFDSMGDLFLAKGDLEKSFINYNKAYELSNQYGSQMKIAYLFALQQNFNEATRWIDKWILSCSSKGDKSIAYCWRAFYHYLQSDYKEASKDFNEAVKIVVSENDNRLLSNLYYVRAWLELEKKNFNNGKFYITEWVNLRKKINERFPDKIEFEYLLFTSWLELESGTTTIDFEKIKNKSRQVKHISRLDSLRLTNLFNIFYANLLYNRNELTKVLEIKRNIYFNDMTLDTRLIIYNLPTIIDIKARCYEKLGNIDKAIEEYKSITYFNPVSDERRISNPDHHYRLGKLYEKKGLLDDARSEYKVFLEIMNSSKNSNPDVIDAKRRLEKLKVI